MKTNAILALAVVLTLQMGTRKIRATVCSSVHVYLAQQRVRCIGGHVVVC